MRKRKINIEFGRYREADLAQKARDIIYCLTDNKYFPETTPPLNEVIAAEKKFSKALPGTRDGKTKTEIKRKAKKELMEILRRLGIFLQWACDGDVVKMQSTGFDLSKLPERLDETPKPLNFRVKHKGKGSMQLKCNRIKYSKGYHWEWREVNEEIWDYQSTPAASCLKQGLVSGKEYFFRVKAIRTKGPGPYSDEIRAVVV